MIENRIRGYSGFFVILLVVCMIFAGEVWGQGVVNLPRTGQNRCYDASGAEIACGGTGQDGRFQAGVEWPDPRFTASGDCVTDHLTGLMWARDANLATVYGTWQRALDFVTSINAGAGLCGYHDWRLPNLNELESLVNVGEINSAAWLNNENFVNVRPYYYWSSTMAADQSSSAWLVHMGNNITSFNYMYFNYYVWPVRSGQLNDPDPQYPANVWKTGQTTAVATGDDGDLEMGVAWPTNRFVDHSDGTVTDALTGLMWSKGANLTGVKKTWQEALDYVKAINSGPGLSGYHDWRLPNRKEITSLIDRSAWIPALMAGHPFQDVQLDDYWSSTTHTALGSVACVVEMRNGMVLFGDKSRSSDASYTWPVRLGRSDCGTTCPQPFPFFDDFTSDKGWIGYESGAWERGPAKTGGGENGYADPATDHSGSPDNYILGFAIGSDYPNNLAEKSVISPPIDCTGQDHVLLKFWRHLNVEGSGHDHARIYVSGDGANWTQFWENPASDLTDSQWNQVVLDISSVAANRDTVYIKFTMGPTDSSRRFSGWNIDDLEVVSTLAIGYNPASFAFSAAQGGSNPANQTLSISNTGSGALSWSISSDASWLSFSPANGTDDGTVAVSVNIAGLLASTYNGTMTVTALGADNSPVDILVSLMISPSDMTSPNTSITGGPSVTITTNSATFTFTGSDNMTPAADLVYATYLQGYESGWSSFSASTSRAYTNLPNGTYTFQVKAKDQAGNEDLTPAARRFTVAADLTPPTPNPMTWATEPYETSTSSISMAATAASDPSTPIQYYFEFSGSPTGGGGGGSSPWQTSRSYTNSGLSPNHQYGYRVKARDGKSNETGFSQVSYDYTDVETPSGISFGNVTNNSIEVGSTNTPSGLTRGGSGLIIYNVTKGTNSNWKQDNSYWTSSSLSPNIRYGFRAKARNGDGNETLYSVTVYRYTLANVPGAAPFSNATLTSIRANWTANGNPTGTQYFCENTTLGTISGWTTSTYWNSTGLTCGDYSFRVKAKNLDGIETEWTPLGPQSPICNLDLIETSVSNSPTSVAVGRIFQVTDTAKNQGTVASGPSMTRYYLSLNTLKDATDKLLEGSRSVPALAPGATSTGTTDARVPDATPAGFYYLLACADDTKVLTETNENNNCKVSSTRVQVVP